MVKYEPDLPHRFHQSKSKEMAELGYCIHCGRTANHEIHMINVKKGGNNGKK